MQYLKACVVGLQEWFIQAFNICNANSNHYQ